MKRIFKQSILVLACYLVGKWLALQERTWQLDLLPHHYVGTYRSVYHAAMLLAYFDLGTGAIRHVVGFRQHKERRAAFLGLVLAITTLVYVAIFLSLLLLYKVLSACGSTSSGSLLPHWWALFPLGYLIILNVTLKAWLRGLGHVVPAVLLHQLGLGLFLLFNAGWWLPADASLERILAQGLLPYLLLLFLYLGYMAYIGVLQVSRWQDHFDVAFVRAFVHYAFFTLASGGILRIMPRIDAIMVHSQCGGAETAMYDMAYFLAFLVNLPLKVAKNTAEPTFAMLFLRKEYTALARFYQKVTLHQSLAVVLGVLLVHEQVPYCVMRLPSETWSKVYHLFLILSMAEIVNAFLGTGQLLLLLSKHYMLGLLIPLVLLLGIVSNYVMIDQLGTYGAAWATFGTLTVGGLVTTLMVWYCLGIHPFTKQMGYLFPMIAITLTVQHALPVPIDTIYQCLFHGMVTLFTYGTLVVATGSSPELNEALRRMVRH